MADPVALVALALDAAIGWPDRLYARVGHPVGAFARFLNLAERLGADSLRYLPVDSVARAVIKIEPDIP